MNTEYSSPIEFFLSSSEKYGDISRFRAGNRRGYFINHPELIKQILVTNQADYVKEDSFKRVKHIMGNGILTSDGDFYRQQRRAIQPAFHRQKIDSLAQLMSDCASDFLAQWEDGQTIDILQEMSSLSLKIIARCLFAADLGEQAREIGEAVKTILYAAPFAVIPQQNYQITNSEKLVEVNQQLDNIIYGLIAQRETEGVDRGDLLSMLLFSGKDGYRMPEQELRDEIVTILIAGHETLATSLSWTWYLLAQHPDVFEAIQAESREHLTAENSVDTATVENLKYARRVFTEAMRLYPPIWAIIRLSIRDTKIDQVKIPKDSVVVVSQYVTHRDKRFFENPEQFDPSRWTEDFTKELPNFAYFPFGGGMRRCIGEQFAWMEGILMLARIAGNWKFEIAGDKTMSFDALTTLHPKNGIKLKLQKT